MAFIWNEARYPATIDPFIVATMQTLSSTARTVHISNETEAKKAIIANATAAIFEFANSWQLGSFDLLPTTQVSCLIQNTHVIILILIQEFSYLGTINGLSMKFNIYSKLYPHSQRLSPLSDHSTPWQLSGHLQQTGMSTATNLP